MTNLERYTHKIESLRLAREVGNEASEDFIEGEMLVLWEKLTDEEKTQTKALAHRAFPFHRGV